MPIPIKVVLSPFEDSISKRLTDLRLNKGNLTGNFGNTDTSRRSDEIGSPAEIGVPLGIGVDFMHRGRKIYPYSFVNNGKAPDLGKRIQIRAVPFFGKTAPKLALRLNHPNEEKRDDPSHIFILCQTGFYRGATHVSILGWMYGEEMQRPEWFEAPDPTRPANYFVPAPYLRCCSTFPIRELDEVWYPDWFPNQIPEKLEPHHFIKVFNWGEQNVRPSR